MIQDVQFVTNASVCRFQWDRILRLCKNLCWQPLCQTCQSSHVNITQPNFLFASLLHPCIVFTHCLRPCASTKSSMWPIRIEDADAECRVNVMIHHFRSICKFVSAKQHYPKTCQKISKKPVQQRTRRHHASPDSEPSDTIFNMSHQAQLSLEKKGQGGIRNRKGSREEEEIERKPHFSLYGFHKGKLSDCQCQSDRVFYEHLAGPRPGLCSQAVIAVPIVGLRGEERPCAIERGGARPCLPALCSVLAE